MKVFICDCCHKVVGVVIEVRQKELVEQGCSMKQYPLIEGHYCENCINKISQAIGRIKEEK